MNIAYALAVNPKSKIKISIVQLNLALAAALLILGAAYLYSINSLSTRGYEIRQLEQQLNRLEQQQQHLEMQGAGLQSIARLQQAAEQLDLVPVGSTAVVKDADFALK